MTLADTQFLALLRETSAIDDKTSDTYIAAMAEAKEMLHKSNSGLRSALIAFGSVINALTLSVLMVVLFPVTLAIAAFKPDWIERGLSWIHDRFSKTINLSSSDEHGLSAIHYAAAIGDVELVNELLDLDSAECTHQSKGPYSHQGIDSFTGVSPMHIAAIKGDKELVKTLAKQLFSEMPKDDSGFTPLHYAAMYNHPEIVTDLIHFYKQSDEVNRDTFDHHTVLTLASEYDAVNVLDALIKEEELKANVLTEVGMTDPAGWTPLQHAARFGASRAADWLIKHGARNTCSDTSPDWRRQSTMDGVTQNMCPSIITRVCETRSELHKALPGQSMKDTQTRYESTRNAILKK